MDITHRDTVVIGAGAAGLHTARLLAARGIDHEIVDGSERVGDAWRERYRSLRLFTPRRWAELPGMRLDIGWFAYPTGVQLADYLERCAIAIGSPLRLSTRVRRLSRDGDGRFRLALSSGGELVADHVVVAVGAHHVPTVPPFAADLDPAIRTVHSLDYRGPEDLAPGPVLVVGAGNSGTDLALEAAGAGHATTIAGRHPGQVPGRVDTVIGNLSQIPFTDLPRLGGSELMRGYATGRFRDRAVVLGTLEYTWDIGNYLGSYLFVDAGRTYHDFAGVDVHGFHVGVGGGVQVHTKRSFLARVQIAASEEDAFIQLALSPALGRRERAGMY